MHRGFVKDYRKGIDNPLFKKPLIWHFWGYCLKRANHKDVEIDFNGKPLLLKRGSFLMSLNKASEETGLTIKNIRTAIKSLENHKMIKKQTKQVAKQATLINVINYGLYQSKELQEGKANGTGVAQQGQSNGTGVAIDKNVKELKKNDKNYSEDSDEFRLSLFLLKHIRKNKPDYKKPDLQKWSKDSELLLRKDKRNLEEAKKLIQWVQNDSFEKTNVLSISKLRARYDQLSMKMNDAGKKGTKNINIF